MTPYEFLGSPWFWYSADFPGPKMAGLAWEKIEERLSGQNLDLGSYRHGSSRNPGTRVTVVSLRPEGVLRARGIMRRYGGCDLPLDTIGARELEALIARRIRFVHEQLQAHPGESGHASIRREGPGVKLNPDGTMDE